MDSKEIMLPLIEELNKATEAYDNSNPIMSDMDWDKKYFELVELERLFNYAYPNSPTQNIHYKTIDKLTKVTHNHPMLSLDKTKEVKEVINFIKNKEYITMLKMDGLTCSLHYVNGHLEKAETRGNGSVGEDVTHNAMVLPSIPKFIKTDYTELTIDGEIICTTENFKNWEDKYANTRAFASGSIRLLDNKECAKRGLTFVAWDWIDADKTKYLNLSSKLEALFEYNFTVVPYTLNDFNINKLTEVAKEKRYPIDGLVVKINDCETFDSMGRTDHHFKGGLAFKFADDSVTSYLTDIEYEVSRNGILTPVAIFEPVEFEGTVINRASLHNLSVMDKILGIPYHGQEVEIIKSNMIIPQIVSAAQIENPASHIPIPEICPSCGKPLSITIAVDSKVLVCNNPNCTCRFINQLEHFFSKKGVEVKGLSKATLEKLINWGWVNSISDIYELKNHKTEWVRKPGFGEKSVVNILAAIEDSKNCSLDKFIAALGIPLIGTVAAKELAKVFSSWETFYDATQSNYHFYNIPTFGLEMSNSLKKFDYSEANKIAVLYINFKELQQIENSKNESLLEGKTFVITGKVNIFKNRDELKKVIESYGGKVTGSVSKNTSYLINNDINSDSSKNITAKSLNIPILTEENFINTFNIQ